MFYRTSTELHSGAVCICAQARCDYALYAKCERREGVEGITFTHAPGMHFVCSILRHTCVFVLQTLHVCAAEFEHYVFGSACRRNVFALLMRNAQHAKPDLTTHFSNTNSRPSKQTLAPESTRSILYFVFYFANEFVVFPWIRSILWLREEMRVMQSFQ